jgi:hypothetical protein
MKFVHVNIGTTSTSRWVVYLQVPRSRLGRDKPPVSIGQKAGLSPEPVWTWRKREKSGSHR